MSSINTLIGNLTHIVFIPNKLTNPVCFLDVTIAWQKKICKLNDSEKLQNFNALQLRFSLLSTFIKLFFNEVKLDVINI